MADQTVQRLTAFCSRLAVPETLLGMVDLMTTKTSSIDNRATALSVTIMGAAGDFKNGLHWDAQPMWHASEKYLCDTNSDVITAEAIIWLSFLMGCFWKAEQKNDHDIFERIGYATIG